jgi:hypothetical protein
MSILRTIEKNKFVLGAALVAFLLYKSSSKRRHLASFVPVPLTPVITNGQFAGAAMPLYHVGAPTPPGGDYSFTRRPGYNGKDY